jgi:hypothetical protein
MSEKEPKPKEINAAIESATNDMVKHFMSPTLINEIEQCGPEVTTAEIISTYVSQGWGYKCSETSSANLGIYFEKDLETKFILHLNTFLVFQRKAGKVTGEKK